ncbi:MAG: hypothetical protein ABSG03_14200 [Bryobacteraceae bacterium]
MMTKAKTSRVKHAAFPTADITAFCQDLANWPRSWMGLEKDLPPGEALIECFRPFIEHLAAKGLANATIRQHVDNLWAVGGEIIRDLHYDSSLRRKPADQLLRSAVHQFGGPAVHNASEEQQRSVNATCRQLHRFLTRSWR